MAQLSREDLLEKIEILLGDNTSKNITEARVRGILKDIKDSCYNLADDSRIGAQDLGTSPNYTWDVANGHLGKITLTENSTIAFPTNLGTGQSYALYIHQNSVGGHTLNFGQGYYFPEGMQPAIATGAGALSIVTFMYDGVTLAGVANNNFKQGQA